MFAAGQAVETRVQVLQLLQPFRLSGTAPEYVLRGTYTQAWYLVQGRCGKSGWLLKHNKDQQGVAGPTIDLGCKKPEGSSKARNEAFGMFSCACGLDPAGSSTIH